MLVPAGMPHAIGEGALLVELQEPTDLSILMEWKGFELDGAVAGHLGLGFDVALRAVDRRGLAGGRRRRRCAVPAPATSATCCPTPPTSSGSSARGARVGVEAGFAVLVVVSGSGRLTTAGGALDVRGGPDGAAPARRRRGPARRRRRGALVPSAGATAHLRARRGAGWVAWDDVAS